MDEVFVVQSQRASVFGANDAHGDGLANAEWIPNGEHQITNLDLIAIGEIDRRQVLGVHFEHGDIRFRIFTNDLARQLTAIVQGHFHLIRVFHDVIVGKDIAIFAHDDT